MSQNNFHEELDISRIYNGQVMKNKHLSVNNSGRDGWLEVQNLVPDKLLMLSFSPNGVFFVIKVGETRLIPHENKKPAKIFILNLLDPPTPQN